MCGNNFIFGLLFQRRTLTASAVRPTNQEVHHTHTQFVRVILSRYRFSPDCHARARGRRDDRPHSLICDGVEEKREEKIYSLWRCFHGKWPSVTPALSLSALWCSKANLVFPRALVFLEANEREGGENKHGLQGSVRVLMCH